MAATIAVVYPHMNAIGGDGFWLVREPGGRVRAHRGLRPGRAPRDDQALSRQGLRRDPGARAGCGLDGRRRGRRLAGRARLRADARRPPAARRAPRRRRSRFAREGCPVSPSEAARQRRTSPRRSTPRPASPRPSSSRARPRPRARSASCRRSADTLAHLAGAGLDDFYRGDVGREIAADLEAIGSPVTRGDLETLPGPHGRAALACSSRRASLYNFPPPTQGLAALLILGIYERLGIRRGETVEHHHGLIEATKRAFAIRDRVVHRSRPAAARSGGFPDARGLRARGGDRSTCAGPRPSRSHARRGRHDLDGRDRPRRARGLLHPVALLGVRLGLRAAADRHPLAEPRRLVLARPGRREPARARAQALPHAESRRLPPSTTGG